jgi:hypothetical protein
LKAKPEASNRKIAKQVKADDKTVASVRRDLESTAEIPQLEKTVGADGKKRAKPKRKSESKPRLPEKSAEVSAEERAAYYAATENPKPTGTIFGDLKEKEPHPDRVTPEQQWQWSLQSHAGDSIAMQAFWTRQFGKWENFKVTPEISALITQAVDAWKEVGERLGIFCKCETRS